jgi:hypothetical protein
MADTLNNAQSKISAVATSLSGGLIGGIEQHFPAFDEVPKVDGEPQSCLWGFFDKHGKKDEVGSEFPDDFTISQNYRF